MSRPTPGPRVARTLVRALIAGVPALGVNLLLLGLADHLGIVTARGGFQRLAKIWLAPALAGSGIDRLWAALALPDPGSTTFMLGFKCGVGLGMAVLYALVEPRLPGRALAKGLWCALAVWVVNAAVVLLLLGEGFAGLRSLSPLGIVAFATAHTAFFVALSVIYVMTGEPIRSAADMRAGAHRAASRPR